MTLKLIALLASIATLTAAQIDMYQQLPSKYLQVPSFEGQKREVPSIPFTLQIPRQEDPVQFNTYLVPSTELKPPQEFEAPQGEYYEVPVPSQDLQLPSEQAWNPDNDPALLYELPVEITKEIVPTNLHPKKYDKAVFEKVKPYSLKPKAEVTLVPIKVQDYLNKQKQQDKAVLNYAKLENKKQNQADKVFKNHKHSHTPLSKTQREPVSAASVLNTHSHDNTDSSQSASHHHVSPTGERVEFQVHGHAGPKTYKWGFDTGNGKNRHFRYEESNKEGHVKGHYGYYDTHGKLQMVHYNANPHDGFHAEGGNFGQ